MREVNVAVAAPGHTSEDAYRIVADYKRYPDVAESVLGVEIEDLGDGRERCTWEVKFRRGILRWTEEGVHDEAEHRIDFALVEGDLDEMKGHWLIEDAPGGGSVIRFWSRFDMGIPTLEHLIEPVAADTLRANVVDILHGLFGSVEELAEAGADR
ncbi:hypothetical protein ALI22I_00745 [Saccharothrix sp. ALI-22-I]|uniref:type II toxin-antitoxin system RatA family toxin n=1 Tax=Saccharothrix sp. ALI-22-I TaxID=1933778 RepID=UPI00097BB5D1|nr:SRPBCC family protein [Saccharothrix sp. ALI-22-I]ONI92994.1 hypothetical protein ALI22I_00745 [Saccharothrix sp. ALI-22-I]